MSPSLRNGELSQLIPRLLPGQLIARHVATVPIGETSSCDWCGKQLQAGQQWMLDVYEQPGNSETSITIGSKQQVFSKTVVLKVHAACLSPMCVRAVHDFTEQVQISAKSTQLQMSNDQVHGLVWSHFKWAVRWISWHHQFIVGEPILLELATKRPQLVHYTLPSFALTVRTTDAAGTVLAPMSLIAPAFVEALYTRVYKFELTYRGKFQPLAQLKSAFSKSAINTDASQCNVAAFAHMVLQTNYCSSSSAEEQRVKLLVKVRPSALHMVALRSQYEVRCMNEGVAWTELQEDAALAHAGDFSWQPDTADGLRPKLAQSFDKAEQCLDAVIAAAGMQLTSGQVPAFDLSTISISKMASNRTGIKCYSNCYQPNKQSLAYYFFRDSYEDNEQPVFCYSGVARGLLPIAVSSPVLLAEEMREAGLVKTDIPQLTVMMSHISANGALRSSKAD